MHQRGRQGLHRVVDEIAGDGRHHRDRRTEAQALADVRATAVDPLAVESGQAETDQQVRCHHIGHVVLRIFGGAHDPAAHQCVVVALQQHSVHDEIQQQRGDRHEDAADPETLVDG